MPEWYGTIEEEEQEMLDAQGWNEYDELQAAAERVNERLRSGLNGMSASDYDVNVTLDGYDPVSERLCANWPRTASETQVGGDHYLNVGMQPLEYTFEVYGYYGVKASIHTKVNKYLTREKGSEIEDIDKAIHCLELLKEFHGEA